MLYGQKLPFRDIVKSCQFSIVKDVSENYLLFIDNDNAYDFLDVSYGNLCRFTLF